MKRERPPFQRPPQAPFPGELCARPLDDAETMFRLSWECDGESVHLGIIPGPRAAAVAHAIRRWRKILSFQVTGRRFRVGEQAGQRRTARPSRGRRD